MDIDLFSEIIKDLILDNEEVTLPGLGTFVSEVMPSTFSDKGYTINPPYRRLSFRQRDSGNGRLLIEFYADANGTDYGTAERIISEYISGLRATLQSRKIVVFPGLGRLRATKENAFFFIADEDLDIYPYGIGLEPVSLKTHEETPDEVSDSVAALRRLIDVPAVPSEDAPRHEDIPRSGDENLHEEETQPQGGDIQEKEIEPEELNIPEGETAPEKVNIPEEEARPEVVAAQEEEPGDIPEKVETEEENIPEKVAPKEVDVPENEEPENIPEETVDASEGKDREEVVAEREELEGRNSEKVVTELEGEAREEVVAEREELEGKDREGGVAEPEEPEEEVRRKEWRARMVRRRRGWRTAGIVTGAVVGVALLALVAFLLLAHLAPDLIDSILYTPEELRIINY